MNGTKPSDIICTTIILMPLFFFIWMVIKGEMQDRARSERIKKKYEAERKAGLIKPPTSSSYSDWDDDEEEDDDDYDYVGNAKDGRWLSNSDAAIIPFPGIFEIGAWMEAKKLDKQLSERE